MSDLPGLTRYPHVFQPLAIGPVEVPNRIYIPPHGIALEAPIPGFESYGQPAAEHAHYFAERAAGGVGLIFHSLMVAPMARQVGLTASPWFKEALPSFSRVAEMVHEQGAKIMAEIYYAPRSREQWEPLGPDRPTLGASVGQQPHGYVVRRQMTKDEISRYIETYVTTTRHLREAGYDGVEVHASHGVLIEHFLSPYFNRREDEYGGSVENRCRLLVEALQAVHSEIGPEMAVGIRLNADELVTNGLDQAANREIIEYLAPMGLLHFVDLDVEVGPEQGHLMTTSFFEPKLHNAERVANVSPAARPSLVVLATPGRVTQIAEAERFLASGAVDMVGAARGHIAEPRLVKNALEGKERRSRTCIAANHCTGGGTLAGGFGCAVNPAAGREERWGTRSLVHAPRGMRVTVVGGGPAGLEAARVAALRGHRVRLFEARPQVGGAVELWSRIPGREHLATLGSWFARELAELGVEVETGVAVSEADVVADGPDAILLATGASYSRQGRSGFEQLPIPGWDGDLVHTVEAVLDGSVRPVGTVVVLDDEGLHAAVGVAELCATTHGAQVHYVTRHLHPAPGLAASLQLGYVIKRLKDAGIVIHTSTYFREIRDGSVTVFDTWTGEERSIDASTVVLATMREPVDALAAALDGKVPAVYLIGDALAPRGLREATYEGQRFARAIGEESMPSTIVESLFEPMGSLRPAALA